MVGVDGTEVAVAFFTGLSALFLGLTYRASRRRERREHLLKKLEAGRALVKTRPDELLAPFYNGRLPAPEAGYFRDLVSLLDPGDQVAQEDIKLVLDAFNLADRGGAHTSSEAQPVVYAYRKVEDRVAQNLPKWEEEIQRLSK